MTKESISRLKELLNTVPAEIRKKDPASFERRPAPSAWSKKEILGHLVDSAANNHHRFVRARYEEAPHIVYQQNNWVEQQNYQDEPLEEVLQLWESYNRHLVHVISQIPEADLQKRCSSGPSSPPTLQWLISDYVDHMEHHLHQILD
jgi:hypothetical protein